jgi:hypothetical protein
VKLKRFELDARECVYMGAALGWRRQVYDGAVKVVDLVECHHEEHYEPTVWDCCRCRHHQFADNRKAPESLDALVPIDERVGDPIREWAIGVVTAPRETPTLGDCLAALVAAGWSATCIYTFAEPNVDLPEAWAGPVTRRPTRLGAWSNYYLALAELIQRHPDADAFAVLQDDAILTTGHARQYLERALWPGGRALVSLYTPTNYTDGRRRGWNKFRDERWIWGALAFLWPRELLLEFLGDQTVLRAQYNDTDRQRKVDIRVGKWAQRAGVAVYHPRPSLVQHVGETSTLWDASIAAGRRCAEEWAGDMLCLT